MGTLRSAGIFPRFDLYLPRNLIFSFTSHPVRTGRPHVPTSTTSVRICLRSWTRLIFGGYRFKCKPLPLCLLKSVAEQAQVLDRTLGCHLVAPPGGVMRVIPSPLPPPTPRPPHSPPRPPAATVGERRIQGDQ